MNVQVVSFANLMLVLLLKAAVFGGLPGQTLDKSAWKDFKPSISSESSQRSTDQYPLSDQQNQGNWTLDEPMSDEFNGDSLDTSKWIPNNPHWQGRPPAFFSPDNVSVSGGQLHLTMRLQDPPENLKQKGYHTYSSAAVQNKETILYGYIEVRAKAISASADSGAWLDGRTKTASGDYNSTEIDIFETGGKTAGVENRLFNTVHVYSPPPTRVHQQIQGRWQAPFKLTGGYHVYGLEWDAKNIKFYFDGALIRQGPNTNWHEPMLLNIDTETSPQWFGLPKSGDLPAVFNVDYVRVWKKG